MEVASEEAGTFDVDKAEEFVTDSGLRIRDLRIGGGQPPQKGYLAVLDFT
jgi:hypothetical protein